MVNQRWTAKKLSATVLDDIWPEVAFFTLVATMVTLVSEKTTHSLAMSSQLLTVLGTVLGLVVSFRTSSAYERYQEGRKLWTNITIACRNIGQIIWIHVPSVRQDKDIPVMRCIIEKKTMINLVQAFAVSVKHFLRGEPGIYYQDLYPLVCYLPQFVNHVSQTEDDVLPLWYTTDEQLEKAFGVEQADSSTPSATQEDGRSGWFSRLKTSSKSEPKLRRRDVFDPERALPTVTSDRMLKPARNPPPATIYDFFPFFRLFKPLVRLVMPGAGEEVNRSLLGRKIGPKKIGSNVPMEITLFLSSYQAWLMKKGLLQPAIANSMTSNIGIMQDAISNLERILRTPLPFAYQAHLRMSLWLYLFFLPFQIYTPFKYLTIPATCLTSFLLLGFLEIGQEIENPFGYDSNDLNLDEFCLSIGRELHEITAHTCADPDDGYMFSERNQPFAPGDRRTADELVKMEDYSVEGDADKGMNSVKRTMLKNWKQVHMLTAK